MHTHGDSVRALQEDLGIVHRVHVLEDFGVVLSRGPQSLILLVDPHSYTLHVTCRCV